MNKTFTLSNDVWEVDVVPGRGACITKAEYKSRPILRPATHGFFEHGDVFETGCFPMIPYSNRIEDGSFKFQNRTHLITPNRQDQTYPIHGNAWALPWSIESADPERIVMTLTHSAKKGEWPWCYKVRQIIKLSNKNMTITLELENTDDEAWPAGLGLHPFFAKNHLARVKFESERMWLCREDLIPTHATVTPWQQKFSEGVDIKGMTLDNCFDGWGRKAIITWAAFDERLEMTASDNLTNLVVYTAPQNDFFCLEPVNHANNAIGSTSSTVLAPSERLDSQICFKISH